MRENDVLVPPEYPESIFPAPFQTVLADFEHESTTGQFQKRVLDEVIVISHDTLNYETPREWLKMPYCRNCGAEVLESAKFCPNCAAPQHQGEQAVYAPAPQPKKVKGPPKPMLVLALSLAQFVIGGALVVVGFIGLLGLSWLGALFVILGFISVAAGFTTWRANPAAGRAVPVTGAGYVLIGLLLLPAGPESLLLGALGILFGVYLIFWVRGKEGRGYLRRGP